MAIIFWILGALVAIYGLDILANSKYVFQQQAGIMVLLGTGVLWIIAALLSKKSSSSTKITPQTSSQTRKCPFCAEQIKPAAIVCKHCGRDVPALIVEKPKTTQIPNQTDAYKNFISTFENKQCTRCNLPNLVDDEKCIRCGATLPKS